MGSTTKSAPHPSASLRGTGHALTGAGVGAGSHTSLASQQPTPPGSPGECSAGAPAVRALRRADTFPEAEPAPPAQAAERKALFVVVAARL